MLDFVNNIKMKKINAWTQILIFAGKMSHNKEFFNTELIFQILHLKICQIICKLLNFSDLSPGLATS